MKNKNVLLQRVMYIYGWLFVHPRRWFFINMVRNSSARWWFRKSDHWPYCSDWKYNIPNIHWWILYKTIFRFFSWLGWDGWRYFATYNENGYLKHVSLLGRILRRIGRTTAVYACSGGECFHCGSERGCPIELSRDETGVSFVLEDTWERACEDGTDYRFCGTTICPVCGYRSYYEDGSL